LIDLPAALPRAAAVVAPPHPDYGGTMRTRVVYEVGKGLARAGCAALRFNYRGVGSSAGTWTPEEPACAVADFRAGLDAMRDRHPGLALWSVGYSFGAWVATVASDGDAGVTAVVAIAPPVDSYDFSLLARSSAVKLIVQAEFDEFAPGRAVQRFYATLLEPRELVVIDGADHAFDGHALDVGDAIEELLGDFGDRVA
jgi:alpha/beta superfamily hydrolase